MNKLFCLYQLCYGVYYLRIICNKKKYCWLFGMKDFYWVRIYVLDLNMKLVMNDFDLSKIKKLDVEVVFNGVVSFRDVKFVDVDIVFQIIEKLGLIFIQFS